MKKNLFLLLSVYCFVVQPIIAGILRGNVNFYYFAGINILFIILISRLYFSVQNKQSDVSKSLTDIKKDNIGSIVAKNAVITSKNPPSSDTRSNPVSKKTSIKKTRKARKFSKSLLLWVLFFATLLWMVVTFFYLNQMFSWVISLLLSLVSGYLWFWILTGVFGFSVKKELFFRCYRYILLVGSLILLGLLTYNDFQSPAGYLKSTYNQASDYISKYVSDFFEKDEDFSLVDTGTILNVVLDGETVEGNTGTSLIVSGENNVGTEDIVLSGETSGIEIGENSIIEDESQEVKKLESSELSPGQSLTMIQAVRHLLEHNNMEINTKPTVKFTHVGYTDTDYPYFNAAYKYRLIGKNTKPDTLISCDVYVVMKGIIEKWKVGSYSDIRSAYWNVGKKLGKINGCKQGEKVTSETL